MSKFQVTSHGKKFDFDTETWDTAVIMAHVQQGIKIRLDRSSASLTKANNGTVESKLIACEKVYTSISSGEMPKSGGGGSRLTPQERSLKVVLKTKVTFLKGETVSEAMTRLTKEISKQQNKEYEVEMDLKVKTLLESTDIYKDQLKAELSKNAPVDLSVFEL